MDRQNWSGVLVYGDIRDNGLLSYVSNFGARLSGGLVLIPAEGDPRLLSFDGGRMVPAGALTTWIEDVRAAGKVDEAVTEWLGELPERGRIAVCGFDIMSAAVHDTLIAVDKIANAEDATSYVAELARRKSGAEIGVIETACGLLRDVESAVTAKHQAGGTAADCALLAEKTARNNGAQDARTLFSVDGGRTFIPFQALSDQAFDPLTLYVAVRVRGYWADGFMTFPNSAGAVVQALDGMIAGAKAGAGADDLRPENHSEHALLGPSLGCGIGCALEETPYLEATGRLKAGDVVSLKVGDAATLASAIVHITDHGNDVLWRAGQ